MTKIRDFEKAKTAELLAKKAELDPSRVMVQPAIKQAPPKTKKQKGKK